MMNQSDLSMPLRWSRSGYPSSETGAKGSSRSADIFADATVARLATRACPQINPSEKLIRLDRAIGTQLIDPQLNRPAAG